MSSKNWITVGLLFSSAWIIEGNAAPYYLQVGSYRHAGFAESDLHGLEEKLHVSGKITQRIINRVAYYQVQLGPYLSLGEANSLQEEIKKMGRKSFIRVNPSLSVPPVHRDSYSSKKRALTSSLSSTRYSAPTLIEPAYSTRSIGEGTLGQRTSFFNGELMYPVLPISNGFAYIDGGGKYGKDEAWLASLGTGFRKMRENYLFGAYVFGDYNQSIRNQSFWIINPGLEWISPSWDAVLNAYLPVSRSVQSLGVVPGWQLGYQSTHFSQHTIFEDYYNILDTVGAGLDGEVGYSFPSFYNVRAFVGGYYFNPIEASDFAGVEGGIEVPIGHGFTVVVHDAYDRVQRNTIMGTLRVTLDNNPKINPVQSRLFDPLRRHLGSEQTGAGIPIVSRNKFIGARAINTNAWFFSPGGDDFLLANGFSNCTYENPCGTISQAAITGINTLATGASLLINSGTYNNPLVGTGLSFFYGQNIIGRTNNFLSPASGAQRPLINDTLILAGNNNIEGIRVNANTTISGNRIGINIPSTASGFVNINNSSITSVVDGLAINAIGINSDHNGVNFSLTNSEVISSISNSAANSTTGINLDTAGPFVGQNIAVSSTGLDSLGATAVNVVATQASLLNSSSSATVNSGAASSFSLFTGAVVTIKNSSLSTTLADGASGGLTSYVLRNEGGYFSLDSSLITLNASNFSGGAIIGINGGSGYNFNITNSMENFNATNSGTYVTAVNLGSGNATITNMNIFLNLNNTGDPNFNYGINNANSNLDLNQVKIGLRGTNLEGPVVGMQNGHELTYQNTQIGMRIDSPGANAKAYAGSGSVTNLGNVTCIVLNNGSLVIGGCP